MRQTRKLRGGATPIQIRAYQTHSSKPRSSKPRSSKSGRQLSRKYRFPAADYFERIMAQIKEEAKDAEALKKLDREFRKAAALKRKQEIMAQIKEEAEDAEALKEMDREFRNQEKLERKKKKRETNNILAGLFSELKIK